MQSSRWAGVWPLIIGLALLIPFTPRAATNVAVLTTPEETGTVNGGCYQYDFARNQSYRRLKHPWYCTVTLTDETVITAQTATTRFNILPKDGDSVKVRNRGDAWLLTTGIWSELRYLFVELLPVAFGGFLTYLGIAALRSTPSQTSPTPSTAPATTRPSGPRAKK